MSFFWLQGLVYVEPWKWSYWLVPQSTGVCWTGRTYSKLLLYTWDSNKNVKCVHLPLLSPHLYRCKLSHVEMPPTISCSKYFACPNLCTCTVRECGGGVQRKFIQQHPVTHLFFSLTVNILFKYSYPFLAIFLSMQCIKATLRECIIHQNNLQIAF